MLRVEFVTFRASHLNTFIILLKISRIIKSHRTIHVIYGVSITLLKWFFSDSGFLPNFGQNDV